MDLRQGRGAWTCFSLLSCHSESPLFSMVCQWCLWLWFCFSLDNRFFSLLLWLHLRIFYWPLDTLCRIVEAKIHSIYDWNRTYVFWQMLCQSPQKLSWRLVLLLLWLPPAAASDFQTVTLCLGWRLGCWKVFPLRVPVPCSVLSLGCAAMPQKGAALHTLASLLVEDCCCLLLSAC